LELFEFFSLTSQDLPSGILLLQNIIQKRERNLILDVEEFYIITREKIDVRVALHAEGKFPLTLP